MKKSNKNIFHLVFLCTLILYPSNSFAQSSDVEDKKQKATVFFSPTTQTVIEGATFVVLVYVNTYQKSINTIDLTIAFPPDKVMIVKPSSGTSLIQFWAEPPSYSNTMGTVHLSGAIPGGITTESGLITAITFQAITTGNVDIDILPSSKILANDDLNTEVAVEFGRAQYLVNPKPSGGTRIYSPTHPFESQWYASKNLIINWDKNPEVTGFSFILDNEPQTIPDNIPETDAVGTHMYYPDLSDGLRYFHLKVSKGDVWGITSHFMIRVDTIPPVSFEPKIELLSTTGETHRLVNYFVTTDSLSGVDHYEVAVINKAESADISPVFVRSESPYHFSSPYSDDIRIVVRAIDRAGNIRDEPVEVKLPFIMIYFFNQYRVFIIIIGILSAILLFISIHYFFAHHIARRIREVVHLMKHEEDIEKIEKVIQAEKKPSVGKFPPDKRA